MRDRRVETGSLISGVMLILFGTLFLIDRFTGVEFGDVIRTWWPLIVIVMGLGRAFDRETVWNGLWLVFVGLWLQAIQLDLYGLTYRNSWPLLLIAIGGGMVLRALVGTARRKEENHGA